MSTQKCNIDEEMGLNLLKKHFDLNYETVSTLRTMLEYRRVTNNRCRFDKTMEGYSKCITELLNLYIKRNNGENVSSSGKLCSIIASRFIIDNDWDRLLSYVKSTFKSRFGFYEFEKIEGTDYFIAYD